MKAVNFIYRSFLFLILTGWISLAFAQKATEVNMKTMVFIEKRETRFDVLLNSVSRQSGVVFSFSTKKIAADKMLNLTPGKQTLETLLIQLRNNTGLDYRIVGTHIIFLDKRAAMASRETRVVTRERYNPKAVRTSVKTVQSNKTKHAAAKAQPTNSKHDNGSSVKNPREVVVREQINTSSSIPKNDTLISKMVIPVDSMRINSTSRLASDKIDSSYSLRIDTSRINPVPSNTAERSFGSSIRTSKGKAERVESKVVWFLGAQISRITGFENHNETFKATGFGGKIKMENPFSKKFSWTAGLSFVNFTGKYTYTRFSNTPGDTTTGSPKDTTINNFAIAPLLVGLKYYFTNTFYLSAEMGLALKGSSATRTKLALAPSLGVLLPTGSYNSIDLSLSFTHIVTGFGTPESNGLENGGYGFVSLRAEYGLGGRGIRKKTL